MKIYKLGPLTTLVIAIVIIGLVVFFPIMLIETLWNTTLAKTYADFSIDFWQSLILWLIVLVLLNILGVFKFEFAVEKIEKTDSLEKDSLNNVIKTLQKESENKPEKDQNVIKSEATEVKEKN